MFFYASLIGGWEKFELWEHYNLALLGMLFLTCVSEVILFKLTIFSGLFSRENYYSPEYNYTETHEEDIYYEDLATNYNQLVRGEQEIVHHYHDHYNSYNNLLFNLTNTTGIFRFLY